MFAGEWINKIWNCIHNGILCSPKKEDPITWMKLEDTMLSEICQLQKEKYVILTQYELLRVAKIIETESRKVVTKAVWDGGRSTVFNGYRVSRSARRRSSRDLLHNNVNIVNTTELYT